MDFKEAQELVKLPKWVVDEDGEIVEELTMDQEFPMRKRLNLVNRNIQTMITINKMVI